MNWVDNQKRGIRRTGSVKYARSKSNISLESSSLPKQNPLAKLMPNSASKAIFTDYLLKQKSFENIKSSLGFDAQKFQRAVSEEDIDELEHTAESNQLAHTESIESDRINLGQSSRIEPSSVEQKDFSFTHISASMQTPKSEVISKSPSQIISQGSRDGSPLFITGIDIEDDGVILAKSISNCSSINTILSAAIMSNVSTNDIVIDSQSKSVPLDDRLVTSPILTSFVKKLTGQVYHPSSSSMVQIQKHSSIHDSSEKSKSVLEEQVSLVDETFESLNLMSYVAPGQKRKQEAGSSGKSETSKKAKHAPQQDLGGPTPILGEIRSKIEEITKKHQAILSNEIFECVSSLFRSSTIIEPVSYDPNRRWDGMPSSPESFSDHQDFQLPTSFF